MNKRFVTDVELEYKKTEASLAVIVTTFLIAFALVLIVFAAGLGVIYTIYKGVMMLGITNSFLSLAVIDRKSVV